MMDGSFEKYTLPPDDGCYAYGLFIDGARWNGEKKSLDLSQPKVLFAKAPVIYLKPSEDTKLSEYKHYSCPVYNTSERRGVLSTTGHSTNFVMYIRLPSDRDESFWIEAGVALLAQLDD